MESLLSVAFLNWRGYCSSQKLYKNTFSIINSEEKEWVFHTIGSIKVEESKEALNLQFVLEDGVI